MSTTETRRNILITKKESGVALVMLDGPGKLNALGMSVMADLQNTLKVIQSDPQIKAVVFLSGKPDNFIIGADLFEIRKITSEEQFLHLSRSGQQTLNEVANLDKPMVIAINGACLGGGLELAMSGHWRIATDAAITQLGLPETRLGILPGLGGTQRLPRLVGLKQALGLILTADPIGAQEALSIGLVDEVVAPEQLLARAEAKAIELLGQHDFMQKRRILLGTVGDPGWPIADVDSEKANKLFAMTERSVRIRTKGKYPAQTRVLEVMKIGIANGIAAGLDAEATAFAELANSEVAANLIALFFQTDFAKQSAASLAAKFNQQDTDEVGIIGGGTMGGAIAMLSNSAGIKAKVKVKPGKAAQFSEGLPGDHIQCIEDYAKLADCKLVVECVVEDTKVKHDVLKAIESAVSQDCVIASNTSALPLADMAAALQNSERFVGLHFFHPVERMPLVEIVSLKTTSRKAVARAADYVTKLGKIPLMVKDGPGFLINRLLSCYLMMGAKLAQEGTPFNWVEESAVDFGMPIAPFEVLDEVGMDLAFKVADNLYKVLGERMQPPRLMYEIPKLGLVGKKTGIGAYLYDESGKKKEINPEVAAAEGVRISPDKPDADTKLAIAHQLIFPMIDEAARCLEERIVMKPREIDMAIVYGIGFPPFRGGLLKYADKVGLQTVADGLREADEKSSNKRGLSELIRKYIEEGRGFYSRGGKEED